jgi:branched-chain amino acid transport system substrate-binding protein
VGQITLKCARHGAGGALELKFVNVPRVRAWSWHPREKPLAQHRGSTLWVPGLLGLGVAACGAREPTTPTSVEVGVAVPLASSGLMLEARQAWQLVLEDINTAGGVNDAALAVVEQDTPLQRVDDLGPVADGFVELANGGYKYIISLLSGPELVPMMDAAMPQGVLAMSVTSEDSADDLAEYDGMLLRAILPTDRLIDKQALALQSAGLRSMAVIGETVNGEVDARHDAMLEAYRACATCSAASITYPAEADLYRYDWQSVGERALSTAPDVIYLTSSNTSALLDTLFWTERAGYTGSYYFAFGAYMATLHAAMPGSRVPERFRSYDLALPPSAGLTRFLARYEERYGDSFVPEPRLIAFADYLVLLALAMTSVGADDARRVSVAMKALAAPPGERFGPLDFAAAVAAVRAGRDIDFDGFSGPLDFDARGEVADGFVQTYGVTASGDVVALP